MKGLQVALLVPMAQYVRAFTRLGIQRDSPAESASFNLLSQIAIISSLEGAKKEWCSWEPRKSPQILCEPL
jgi:hypothetical protein